MMCQARRKAARLAAEEKQQAAQALLPNLLGEAMQRTAAFKANRRALGASCSQPGVSLLALGNTSRLAPGELLSELRHASSTGRHEEELARSNRAQMHAKLKTQHCAVDQENKPEAAVVKTNESDELMLSDLF